MEPRDIEIVKIIASIVKTNCPEKYERIIFNAKISSEMDYVNLKYNYVDGNGKEKWFLIDNALTENNIFCMLREHREIFRIKGMGDWVTFSLSLEGDSGKISLDLGYKG